MRYSLAMPYVKNKNAFFDISLGFLLLYWPGFAKATQLICLSFSNYIKLKKNLIQKMENETRVSYFLYVPIFFIETKKPGC
jgi:hypothetical protein